MSEPPFPELRCILQDHGDAFSRSQSVYLDSDEWRLAVYEALAYSAARSPGVVLVPNGQMKQKLASLVAYDRTYNMSASERAGTTAADIAVFGQVALADDQFTIALECASGLGFPVVEFDADFFDDLHELPGERAIRTDLMGGVAPSN